MPSQFTSAVAPLGRHPDYPAFAQGAEDLDVPVLTESVSLAGGETVEAQVVFEVLEGEELGHLFWMPEGAMLTVAQLEGE